MRDINDYTHMTRKEFLESVKIDGTLQCCPGDFGLRELECTAYTCDRCWKQSVKNVEFKDDNMEEVFSKKDLKNGMGIVTKGVNCGDEEKWTVFEEFLVNNDSTMNLGVFNDNLKSNIGIIGNIVRVYKSTIAPFGIMPCTKKEKLIWQRSEVDWSKVAVDTKIESKAKGGGWCKRYFAKYENGKIFAWINGGTSFSTDKCNVWECVRLYKEKLED